MALWQAWRGHPVRALLPTPAGPAPIEIGRTAAQLPFAGGLADQPACTIAAFRIMDAAARALEDPDEGSAQEEEE